MLISSFLCGWGVGVVSFDLLFSGIAGWIYVLFSCILLLGVLSVACCGLCGWVVVGVGVLWCCCVLVFLFGLMVVWFGLLGCCFGFVIC